MPHHVAHAASAGLSVAPDADRAVLVLDGRGEVASHLAGVYRGTASWRRCARQELPHSLGLLYEDLTRHLGFLHSSDEYKVMALASYGEPRHPGRAAGAGAARPATAASPWIGSTGRASRSRDRPTPRCPTSTPTSPPACRPGSRRCCSDLAGVVARRGRRPSTLTMAGGVALNCVANARIAAEGPYERVWVQPAAGDAGTALGAALHVAAGADQVPPPMSGADLGRGWTRRRARGGAAPGGAAVHPAGVDRRRGRRGCWPATASWPGSRAAASTARARSATARCSPTPATRTRPTRMNDVKGREQFRPIAPMVLAERAAEIFEGVLPSPYMLFVHRVRDAWRDRIPAVVHVDGTARVQTVDPSTEPLVAEMLTEFERRTGLPVVVNTSLNTAGRPMVDTPREAMELFGSAPVDLLAIGPYAVHRPAAFGR